MPWVPHPGPFTSLQAISHLVHNWHNSLESCSWPNGGHPAQKVMSPPSLESSPQPVTIKGWPLASFRDELRGTVHAPGLLPDCSESPAETTFLLSSFYCPVLLPSLPHRVFLKSTSQKSHALRPLSQALLLGNPIRDTCLKGGELTGVEISAPYVSVQHPWTEDYCHCLHLKVYHPAGKRRASGPRVHTSPTIPAPYGRGIFLNPDLAASQNTGLWFLYSVLTTVLTACDLG